MCVRVSACMSIEDDPCGARTSACAEGTRIKSLSFCLSDLEEEGSLDVEDTAGGGTVEEDSTAGLELIREYTVEVGVEVEDGGVEAAREERREGDKEEEDLGTEEEEEEEEEVVLEDVILLSE